ncbi:sulfite exporter TauE/SafE family protein [Desulfovibrio sp. OttesenSCG-928-C06]|nr:sulfite exporter TauE/SafE family protein [Desulfovibrio sp. OttesenSCG-928-C06]
MLILLGLLSVVTGVLIGASGVGGVLLIPLLAYFGGLSIHGSMGTALFSFFFTGVIATITYQRYGSIDWKITLPVCGGSLLTSYLGAQVNAYTDAMILYVILGAIIVLSSYFALRPLKGTNVADRLGPRGRFNTLLAVGLGVGFLCGLTGIGGGLVSIPVMLILGFHPLASIGTSQVLQSIVAISGSISNIANGFVDFGLVWWVTLLELLGVGIGVRIAHKVPVQTLKTCVSTLCLIFGVYMIIKAFML